MNSLGIVARAVLMEAEETRMDKVKKYGKRAAVVAGLGAAGLGGLGAVRGARAAYGQGAMAMLKGAGRSGAAHLMNPLAVMRGLGRKAGKAVGAHWTPGAGGGVGGKFGSFGVGAIPGGGGYSAGGAITPEGIAMLKKAGKYAGGAALAGGAGYGAYRAYKRRKAKEAATRAYWETFNALMEADEPSTAKKWGKRIAIGAAGLGAAHLGMSGGSRALAAYRKGRGVMDVARAGVEGVKRGVMNPLKQAQRYTGTGKFNAARRRGLHGQMSDVSTPRAE